MLSQGVYDTRLSHERYQMELSFWDKFVIWSYTFESGTVNKYLLGLYVDDSDVIAWSNRVFVTYEQMRGDEPVPSKFRRFEAYLTGSYTSEPSLSLRKLLLKLYVLNLQKIILDSPALTRDVVVYKASTPYPGLEVGDVYQKPFNSTSYRIDMNYATFLPQGGFCCMHKIILKAGTRALFLSPLLSAYPDESEVLLPHSITFHVKYVSSMSLDIPKNPNVDTYKRIQDQPLKLGPVYAYNPRSSCQTFRRSIQLYNSVVY